MKIKHRKCALCDDTGIMKSWYRPFPEKYESEKCCTNCSIGTKQKLIIIKKLKLEILLKAKIKQKLTRRI